MGVVKQKLTKFVLLNVVKTKVITLKFIFRSFGLFTNEIQ